jgi:outer membrane lipoprotein-sorting protein
LVPAVRFLAPEKSSIRDQCSQGFGVDAVLPAEWVALRAPFAKIAKQSRLRRRDKFRAAVRTGNYRRFHSVLCAFLLPAIAQSQPNVEEILQKVRAAYSTRLPANEQAYEVERVVTERDPATGKTESTNYRLAFKLPDKYRLEMRGDFGVPGIDEVQVISDGAKIWEWSPKSNQYRMYELTGHVPDSVNPEVVDDDMGIWRLGMASYWKSEQVRILREETIPFGGQPTDCFVIELTLKGGEFRRDWIDKTRFYVLRQEFKSATIDYKSLKLNEPLPDALFEFTPPETARRISQETPFGG